MEVKPYKIPHPFRKLDKELIDSIVKDIADGSTHKLASLCNGITPRIFDIWRNQGECDIAHGEIDTLPSYLVLSLSKVKQKEVIRARKDIRESEKGHKGAEWTLEHAYWKDFSSSAAVIDFEERLTRMEESHENEKVEGSKEVSPKES